MFAQLFNWRTVLAVVAIAIVTGTVFYSNYLAKKIAVEEREKVNLWVDASRARASATDEVNLALTSTIMQQNKDIPIIYTNEKDSIVDFLNLDSARVAQDKSYLLGKLKEFKATHDPIVQEISREPYVADRYYYGDSELLKQVRYYPIIQLIIVALFILITLIAISTRNRSNQNKVWAGMAKETAHQLGTPLSSLEGWVEILKDTPGSEAIAEEIDKDISRLKLISDRFGKIGSIPQLEEKNIVEQVQNMVTYIKRRATDRVVFNINSHGETDIPVLINGPLFDWVIENLLKNALDAMEGKGRIDIAIKNEKAAVLIDVTDSGKGISKKNQANVFKPGFTTKKRGWGLGLSLTRRIIEQYHKGEIFVKNSELGKGTTFRIVLKR
jgi:signal transduction histidine kinase